MFIEQNDTLSATFEFADFKEAFSFMSEIALHAESMNHHPTWKNTWNKVEIELTTHDAGNTVTEKDHALAAIIIQCYKKYLQ